MANEFSGENQPKNRKPRGKGRIKKALPLFEQLGINPLTKAIKNTLKIKDPEKQAKLWVDIAKFIYTHAKEDNIPVDPKDSVNRAKSAMELLKEIEQFEQPIEPRSSKTELGDRKIEETPLSQPKDNLPSN